jgi:hypothetical protein
MSTYEIYLRDGTGAKIGMVEKFTSFEFVRRFNAAGTWALEAPVEALNDFIRLGGIAVYRNGTPLFAGNVRSIIDQNAFTLTISGQDDLGTIARRIAYPVPAGAPFNTDYDVRTGLAESVIKQYINVNAGPGATVNRIIPGLAIEADYSRGTTVTGRARFDNLLTLAQSLARQGGLGIRVLDLVFQVYIPADKTGLIVFSEETGTLGEYKLSIEAGAANYLVCGGSGSGSARYFAEGGNSDANLSWGRSEAFLDKGNLAVTGEMVAAIQEELVKSADKVALSFTPLLTDKMMPIDDYDIGDWVTAIIRGQVITRQIQEMKIKIDPANGEHIDMAMGTVGATTDSTGFEKIFTTIKSNDLQMNSMERR